MASPLHTPASAITPPLSSSASGPSPSSRNVTNTEIKETTTHPQDLYAQPLPSTADFEEEFRFIGDLSPEGTFLVAASPDGSTEKARQYDVGVWLSRNPLVDSSGYSRLAVKKAKSRFINSPNPLISSILLPHLEDHCLSVLPNADDLAGLTHVYLDNVHPIFPIFDFETYHYMPLDSPERILLSQTICFAASVNPASLQYLRLPGPAGLSRDDFSRSLSGAMRTSIALGLVRDKIVLVQVFALFSLFTQFSRDRQDSAEFFSRALAHGHTIGLDLKVQSNAKAEQKSVRMFCCLYALDILNASFQGRPVQMHKCDFDHKLQSCIAAQDGCFQLFLRVVILLDRIIELYPPGNSHVLEETFPSFEDLLQEVDSSNISLHLIATIEILYHTVAILSSRSAAFDGQPRSSASSTGQSLSASRVTTIVGDEYCNKLSLFPIIPYAVALSLRVSYRSLQQTKTSFFRARERKQLMSNCKILRDLGSVFASATLMAELGEHLLRKLDAQEGVTNSDSTLTHSHDEPSSVASVNGITGNPSVPSYITNSTGNGGSTYLPYDPNCFDPMSSLDIFEHFEPQLDIEAILGGLLHETP
ncbi:hypothetical protein F1880_009693 [Penicillium rolfsii]|nr:hypothetical protein F1880_009693 [Penicillium rolfsii]